MKDLLEIKIQNKIRSYRLTDHYYQANDDGKYISLGKFDGDRSNYYMEDCDEDYKQKEIEDLKTFADFIEYEIRAYPDDNYSCYCETSVEIGNRKQISKDKLYKLFKNNNKKLTRKTFDEFTFAFRAIYPCTDEDYYNSKHFVEKAKELISDKKNLEYLIKNLNNKKLSNLYYLKKLELVYNINRNALLDLALKKHFKNPIKVTINTSMNGSPSLEVLGYGRDFSYEMHETKRSFNFYVEDGTVIDTKKIYSQEEVLQLKNDTNALVTEDWNSTLLNFDKAELAEIVRENVSKAKLFDDYLSFLNYYKFAKLDISTALQRRKKEKIEKINTLTEENQQADSTIKELEQNCESEL